MLFLLCCVLHGLMATLPKLIQASDICAAPLPCICSGTSVQCNSTNLDDIPQITTTTIQYNVIYLNDNNISTLESGMFSHLSHNASLYLHLEDNSISSVEERAFVGLENAEMHIYLENNNLTTLPSALAQLHNLTELKINGIYVFEPHTMTSIGLTLGNLDIGMDEMITWPQELNYLIQLKTLTIRDMHILYFPENAFNTFQNSLLTFNLFSSVLYHSPDAICSLHKLKTLGLYELDISPDDLIPTCGRPVETLERLNIRCKEASSFPNVFRTFPKLKELSLDCPNLQYIDDHVISNQSVLTLIHLFHTNLTRVPGAIRKLKTVIDLHLSTNQITSVDAYDFSEMPSLLRVYLHNNPIVFVSEFAFDKSNNILKLDFRHTKLRTIPRAILHLSKLTEFFLQGTNIECTCDLSWLLSWDRLDHVQFYGACYQSVETISDFVKNKLHLCKSTPIG